MTALIIDGKKAAQQIRAELKEKISRLPKAPKLAIILVGDDEASRIYVRNKQHAAAKIGIKTELFCFANNVAQTTLLELINQLNQNPDVNGIIVQLPLPAHIQTGNIINAILPKKDVDGFTPYNTGLLQNNEKPYFIAATPLGIMHLLSPICPNLCGKNVVIIGASLIVGRPLATLMLNHECTVTITHIHTHNIKEITQKADIIIAACGVAKMVKADWIKQGVILIDVGINREQGTICGDIDFEDVKDKAAAITPVPGGVGPMTVVMLLKNTYEAYIQQNNSL